jgi:hypothetical protein
MPPECLTSCRFSLTSYNKFAWPSIDLVADKFWRKVRQICKHLLKTHRDDCFSDLPTMSIFLKHVQFKALTIFPCWLRYWHLS